MRRPLSASARLRRLRRERAAFARVLWMPQTGFAYRQRLRKAIAIREVEIERLRLERHL